MISHGARFCGCGGRNGGLMRRDKLKVVAPAPAVPEQGRYVLDDQVCFLLRVAMQRHTSIFTTRMIEGLTQTQFAALAKLYEVGPCSQNHLGRLRRRRGDMVAGGHRALPLRAGRPQQALADRGAARPSPARPTESGMIGRKWRVQWGTDDAERHGLTRMEARF